MICVPDNALTVLQRLEHFGYEAYVVGGCVRDSLLGRTPKDWDVCTNATPQQVLGVFKRFNVIKTGLKHGTVTVMVNHEPIEVTTFRVDGEYSDNRHPNNVTFVSRVEEDLARRDFTINAMAYNPTRGLVDAFGGQPDLTAGIIRCVGEPDARFNEDGLRILRALRFASRYDYALERETAFSMRRNRHLLENVSVERIFSELKGILVGSGVRNMLLAFPEIFVTIIPELEPMIGFDQRNPHHIYDVWTHTAHAVQAVRPDPVLRLTMLLHDIAKPPCFTVDASGKGHFYHHPQQGAMMVESIMNRLKSDTATLQNVVTLVKVHDDAFPETRPDMRRFIGSLGMPIIQQLFEIKKADHAAQSTYKKADKKAELCRAALLIDELMDEAPCFTVKDLAINGKDLMELGAAPSPAMGRLLQTLLTEVQDEQLENSREALSARAASLLNLDF